jgi:hypothetical protein
MAVAALAAAGVAAVVNYRLGHKPGHEEHAQLDELDARLDVAEEPGSDTPPGRVRRILDRLHRDQGIPVERLRGWITRMRQGTLSSEQAALAESDFNALEREADQGGL